MIVAIGRAELAIDAYGMTRTRRSRSCSGLGDMAGLRRLAPNGIDAAIIGREPTSIMPITRLRQKAYPASELMREITMVTMPATRRASFHGPLRRLVKEAWRQAWYEEKPPRRRFTILYSGAREVPPADLKRNWPLHARVLAGDGVGIDGSARNAAVCSWLGAADWLVGGIGLSISCYDDAGRHSLAAGRVTIAASWARHV